MPILLLLVLVLVLVAQAAGCCCCCLVVIVLLVLFSTLHQSNISSSPPSRLPSFPLTKSTPTVTLLLSSWSVAGRNSLHTRTLLHSQLTLSTHSPHPSAAVFPPSYSLPFLPPARSPVLPFLPSSSTASSTNGFSASLTFPPWLHDLIQTTSASSQANPLLRLQRVSQILLK